MACSTITTGSASLQAMGNAFQQGSGLCAGSLNWWHVATVMLAVIVLVIWVVIGQYQAWTENKENGLHYWVTILLALAFIPLTAILFMGR